ncbi:apolipoprotein C-I isoform X1 [Trematomus bernacchii]|uniref:apolipoprotein C-I isoform X1 n=1 Tax=Trematomus bernacchii TaxID=40690 RepID=UPI00146A6A40|nr:apolipoprotein C-I isoform X1 [Trematomus bernacchii]
MRLYLVVAMLVLALAAFTRMSRVNLSKLQATFPFMLCNFFCFCSKPAEAQEAEAEATVEEKFAVFTNQMGEMGKNLADKAQTTFEEIRSSEFVASSQSWFEQQLEKMKQKFSEISQ